MISAWLGGSGTSPQLRLLISLTFRCISSLAVSQIRAVSDEMARAVWKIKASLREELFKMESTLTHIALINRSGEDHARG